MATRIGQNATPTVPTARSDDRFFFTMAIAMALVLVSGFSLQFAMGRSSIHAPLLVHMHGMLFFGWTVFYVLQNGLIATASVRTHRQLGWLGAVLMPLMVVVGIATTVIMVRRGAAPFFFLPLRFLVMNSLSVLVFAGLTIWGIRMRRRTEWHRRLIYCGMAILTGPGFGRLLPMPFMIPWADWGVFAAVMIWPVIGVLADLRRTGHVHPAWWAGIATMACFQLLIGPVSTGLEAAGFYTVITAGAPGAAVAPMAYPPMPPL